MKHVMKHDLEPELARKVAQKAFDSYREKYARYNPSLTWLGGDKAKASFQAKGITLQGAIERALDETGIRAAVTIQSYLPYSEYLRALDRYHVFLQPSRHAADGDAEGGFPVTVLEVENELRYSGVTRIEDLVVSLPQVFSAQNSTIANGASGTATIDLRDLGVARTLVLVNGRRMAGGDGWQGSASYGPDLNAIPAAIVKRVDVLTGGASTTMTRNESV